MLTPDASIVVGLTGWFFGWQASPRHLAGANQGFGSRREGASAFPAAALDGRRTPGSAMYGAQSMAVGDNMQHFGGNRLPRLEMAGGQDLNAFNAAPAPMGRGFGATRAFPAGALGPADPSNCNVLFDGWQGLHGNPAPAAAPLMGHQTAYAPFDQCEFAVMYVCMHTCPCSCRRTDMHTLIT